MKAFKWIGILVLFTTSVSAQTFTEKISRELEFEKKSSANAVMVANINGYVKVEGYNGTKILVEVEKKISAKTTARLEKGKTDVRLGVIDRADTLILFVEGTCSRFGRDNQVYHRNEKNGKGWNYNWHERSKDCREEYDYTMNFTIKIPNTVSVHLSTINDGDIVVEGMKAAVYADNINGNIKLSHISGITNVSTINGDVDLDYVSNPNGDCRYYTLNGDINANFQKGLGASVSFESFNGDFYTNVPSIEALPVELEKKQKGDGVKYKVNGNRYKVGSGGVHLDFETFNGNVYLKEI